MSMAKNCLTEGPVGGVLFRLGVPMFFGGLSMVVFNVTDTYFVSWLGSMQLAALSFTFPVVLFTTSIAHGVGTGVSAAVSRAVGAKDLERARRITTHGLLLGFLLILLLEGAGLCSMVPLFRFLGAPSEILILLRGYMRIWFLGLPCMVLPMIGNNVLRAMGDSKIPSLMVTFAAGLNVILDPVLIFGIGFFPSLGIAGAALATVIARSFMCIWSLLVLAYRDSTLLFERPRFPELWASWKEILHVGFPAMGAKITLPLGAGILTKIVAAYGPSSVAGFGAASRIEIFALMPLSALTGAMGPFVGQNWGALRFERIRESLFQGGAFVCFWGIFSLGVLAFFGEFLGSLFSKDPEVLRVMRFYFRVVPLGYGGTGLLLLATSVMSVLRMPFYAVGVTLVHTFAFSLLLAWGGALLFGLPGIFGGLALASWMGALLGIAVLRRVLERRENGELLGGRGKISRSGVV